MYDVGRYKLSTVTLHVELQVNKVAYRTNIIIYITIYTGTVDRRMGALLKGPWIYSRVTNLRPRTVAARRGPRRPSRAPAPRPLAASRRLGRGVGVAQGLEWSLEPQAKGPPNETDFGGPSAHKSEPTSW